MESTRCRKRLVASVLTEQVREARPNTPPWKAPRSQRQPELDADEPTEARLYRLLRDRLPRTTLFSVGHRATLRPFHDRQLFVQPDGDGPASIVEVSASAHNDLQVCSTNR